VDGVTVVVVTGATVVEVVGTVGATVDVGATVVVVAGKTKLPRLMVMNPKSTVVLLLASIMVSACPGVAGSPVGSGVGPSVMI
jgi:hypothetical protein